MCLLGSIGCSSLLENSLHFKISLFSWVDGSFRLDLVVIFIIGLDTFLNFLISCLHFIFSFVFIILLVGIQLLCLWSWWKLLLSILLLLHQLLMSQILFIFNILTNMFIIQLVQTILNIIIIFIFFLLELLLVVAVIIWIVINLFLFLLQAMMLIFIHISRWLSCVCLIFGV